MSSKRVEARLEHLGAFEARVLASFERRAIGQRAQTRNPEERGQQEPISLARRRSGK